MKYSSKKLLAVSAVLAASAMLHTPAQANAGKAMTWQVYNYSEATPAARSDAWSALPRNVIVVGCGNPNAGGCDAYKGDTPIIEKRRIMCFVPGKAAEPAGYAAVFNGYPTGGGNPNWRFYLNWSGGQIGLSKYYPGNALTSRAMGDKFCQSDLRDPSARMIEHHDNNVGGWSLGGTVHPNSEAKSELMNSGIDCNTNKPRNYWAAINGQPANPWDI